MIDVHMIGHREQMSIDTHGVWCTCGHVARGGTAGSANRRHDDHIVAAIRANAAADKAVSA